MRRTPTGTGVEPAEPANTPAAAGPWWMALICIAAGSAIVAGAIGWLPLKLSPGVPRWVGAAAGLVFVLGGLAIALPPRASRLKDFSAQRWSRCSRRSVRGSHSGPASARSTRACRRAPCP